MDIEITEPLDRYDIILTGEDVVAFKHAMQEFNLSCQLQNSLGFFMTDKQTAVLKMQVNVLEQIFAAHGYTDTDDIASLREFIKEWEEARVDN